MAQKPVVLKIVLDRKCNAEDVRSSIAAIERLRGVAHVEQDSYADDASIDQLDLSTRARNALANAEVFTVKDLTRFSHYELRRLKGLGKDSLRELEAKLEALGTKLRPQTSAEFAANVRRQRDSFDQQSQQSQQKPLNEIHRIAKRLWDSMRQRGYVNQDLRDWEFIDRELSQHVCNSTQLP